ncbi:hypothetical protein D9M70_646430 [compost metagenome]
MVCAGDTCGKTHKLRNTQSRRVKRFKKRVKAKRFDAVCRLKCFFRLKIGAIKKAPDIFDAHDFWQRFLFFGGIDDTGGIILPETFRIKKAKELSDCGQAACL